MLHIQARKKVTSNKQANAFNIQTEKAHKSRNKSPHQPWVSDVQSNVMIKGFLYTQVLVPTGTCI